MKGIDQIRAWLTGGQLRDDGSKELAESWLRLIDSEKEMTELLNNAGFKKILELMKQDFLVRMKKLVEDDPELRAIKRMHIRTLGVVGTEERLDKYIQEFLEEPADVA